MGYCSVFNSNLSSRQRGGSQAVYGRVNLKSWRMSILLSEEEMDSHLSQSERKKCMDMQHILLDVVFKEYLQEKNLFVFSMFSYI